MAELTVTAGIDWSEDHLDACMVSDAGIVLGERRFNGDLVGVTSLCAWLLKKEPDPARIGVAIELKRGPVVTALLERGFRVAGLNPKQLDRFRDRFTMAGAKDDRRDAHALADSLRTDARAFDWLDPEDPLIVQIRDAMRSRTDAQQIAQADANRLRDQLLRYFPQAVKLAGADLQAPWFLELIVRLPTPHAARRVRTTDVQRLLKRHHVRRISSSDVLEMLREPSLPVMHGVADAASRAVVQLAKRIALAVQQVAECEQHASALIAELEARGDQPGHEGEQRDMQILVSLPGVGPVILAVLLAEAWKPLRDRDYIALRALAGVAPVTRRSGKRYLVCMRRACSSELRNAAHHMARASVAHYPHWKAYYRRLRARGVGGSHALRIIADRQLKVMVAALRSGTPYDETKLAKAA